MNLSRRRFLQVTAGAALAPSILERAQAQTYPARNLTLIVPFAPGGATDVLGRLIAKGLEAAWEKNLVVENRPGAGGIVGAQAVARAAPDGHTLLLGSATNLAVNVSLYKELPYDPVKELMPLALAAATPFMLVVHPSLPVTNVAEFIAYAKQRPGQLSYATSGPGVPHHLFVELLCSMTGLRMNMVPYRGSLPALNDVAAGHVPLMMVDLGPAIGTVQAGRVRPLGVSTAQRISLFRDVPPIADTVPGFDAAGWFMMAAPAGLSAPVADKLHAELTRILSAPDVAEQLLNFGLLPMKNRALPDLQKFHVEEVGRWGDVVRKAGIEGTF